MAEFLSFVNQMKTKPTFQVTAIVTAGSLMVVFAVLWSLRLVIIFALNLLIAVSLWMKEPASDLKSDNLQKQHDPLFKLHDE
jgi:hypothetical protein